MTDTRGQQSLLYFCELRIALVLFKSSFIFLHAKYSVVKHSILFAESLLAVKHIAAQIFTRNETCHCKGFSSIVKSFSPS